jgi:D-glycero-alpha-D-manno-heptose-7-phosphate kinase
MKKVIVRAPVRADLAGGTLDLWPLYLFHPGARTVNVAISYHAESEVALVPGDAIEIHLTDQQYTHRYESMAELGADPKAALIHRVLQHFRLTGIRITTRTDAPRGSGLGGSSALAVTLVKALSELAETPVDGDELIALVRDLETRLLGVPAGIQDYYPPVYGGLAALHLNPGAVVRHPIAVSIPDLADHMLLHYGGIAHFSGTNNWEMYKRQIEGKKKVQTGLEKIAESATEMERALDAGNFAAAGEALGHEWQNRKALIEGISTPEIDAAIKAATDAGAWAGKVCGAGGGGCVVFLLPKEKRDDVKRALAAVPGRIVDAHPVAYGLTVERTDDVQVPLFARMRLPAHTSDSLEQLYVYGGSRSYRPHLLAEAVVTQTEPRSGFHLSFVRSYVAPISPNDGSVDWSNARLLDSDKLDIRAVPEPQYQTELAASPENLMQGAAQSEDAFRQFLASSEKLHVLHNPTFSLYSQPHESREAFRARCLDAAKRALEDEAERLESTYRRRIDQLREKSEREQRQIDSSDESASDRSPNDVNVAWGQTLYNITSGKPAGVADGQSVRETDYLDRIAQIQKAWERELDVLREDLNGKATEIEEITVTPTPRNIEVTKYLILWAGQL